MTTDDAELDPVRQLLHRAADDGGRARVQNRLPPHSGHRPGTPPQVQAYTEDQRGAAQAYAAKHGGALRDIS